MIFMDREDWRIVQRAATFAHNREPIEIDRRTALKLIGVLYEGIDGLYGVDGPKGQSRMVELRVRLEKDLDIDRLSSQ